MRVSVLDQSPIIRGHSAARALAETLDLARAAEDLGYQRFWLAEHHGLLSLADPCPEIMVARIAAATRRMRIGTGGILLPYYTPFKVAEQFRMLEALFPGRIDLGLGRAPGGDMKTARALSGSTTGGSYDAGEHFARQVMELVALLEGALPADHPHSEVPLQPEVDTAPQVWVLRFVRLWVAPSRRTSACASHSRISSIPTAAPAVAQAYRNDFRPAAGMSMRAGRSSPPHHALAVFCICADTQAEAAELALAVDVRRLQMAYGINAPIPDLEEARRRVSHLSERDRLVIERERPRAIIGTADFVADRVGELAELYQADELVVVTVTPDYRARLRSYELLATAMKLDRTR